MPAENNEEDVQMQHVNQQMQNLSHNGGMEEVKHNPYQTPQQPSVYQYNPPQQPQGPVSSSNPGQTPFPSYNPPVVSNPYVAPMPSHPPSQPHIQVPKPAAGPVGSSTIKKDAAYYKAIADAKKKAQNAVSELDFSNVNNAVKFFREALAIL